VARISALSPTPERHSSARCERWVILCEPGADLLPQPHGEPDHLFRLEVRDRVSPLVVRDVALPPERVEFSDRHDVQREGHGKATRLLDSGAMSALPGIPLQQGQQLRVEAQHCRRC